MQEVTLVSNKQTKKSSLAMCWHISCEKIMVPEHFVCHMSTTSDIPWRTSVSLVSCLMSTISQEVEFKSCSSFSHEWAACNLQIMPLLCWQTFIVFCETAIWLLYKWKDVVFYTDSFKCGSHFGKKEMLAVTTRTKKNHSEIDVKAPSIKYLCSLNA